MNKEDQTKVKQYDLPNLDLAPTTTLVERKSHKKSHLKLIVVICLAILVLVPLGVLYWYHDALKAIDNSSQEEQIFIIKDGESVAQIAKGLQEAGLIKHSFAFEVYNRLQKTTSSLKLGTYSLGRSLSVEEIVKIFMNGSNSKKHQIVATFYPGSMLNFRHKDDDNIPSHREVLRSLGFDDNEIDTAFSKVYDDHPLFKLLPEVNNLEGLIYADTFYHGIDATVESILRYSFDFYYQAIVKDDLVEKYRQLGLSLYQGIILASIIQREAQPPKDSRGNPSQDQMQIAQVFLKRLREGMKLGSDVTYQYICRLLRVPNNYQIDSPYNTRRYEGLPPGPINSPSRSALLAVANPAEGDYIYFLAGDDGITYFAHTYAEHERNIRNHCQKGCAVQ